MSNIFSDVLTIVVKTFDVCRDIFNLMISARKIILQGLGWAKYVCDSLFTGKSNRLKVYFSASCIVAP